jgi:hypothetical protein
LQAVAVAVALRRDLPAAAPEQLPCGIIERVVFAGDHDPDDGLFCGCARPRKREIGRLDPELAGGLARRGAREDIARLQRPSVQAAELATKLRAARTEHHRQVDAAADGQIASCAAGHRLDGQNVSDTSV